MRRYEVLYGTEKLGTAWTSWGAEMVARRYMRSKRNRIRQARRGNIKVRRAR